METNFMFLYKLKNLAQLCIVSELQLPSCEMFLALSVFPMVEQFANWCFCCFGLPDLYLLYLCSSFPVKDIHVKQMHFLVIILFFPMKNYYQKLSKMPDLYLFLNSTKYSPEVELDQEPYL